MRRFLVLAGFFLGFGCVLHAQAVDTTVCAVLKNPAAFNGKIVHIKGTAVAGFDEFILKDATQDPNCGNHVNGIWLDYPPGAKGKAGPVAMLVIQPARNFAGTYTPPARTPATLNKDKEFKTFDSLLAQGHEKGADMCLGCARYEVTATLVGRIDSVADAKLARDASGKIVGFGGYGNMNAYPARLVLQSVSDVTPKEIDYSKNDAETKGLPIGSDSGPTHGLVDVYDAISDVQAASDALPQGHLKDIVEKATMAYGIAGKRSTGVDVRFGVANEASPADDFLGTKDSPDGVLFNCIFDSDRLQGESLERALIHMGDHVSELRNPDPANLNAPAYVLESNAWVITTITLPKEQQFLTLPGGYLIWDANWAVADRDGKMGSALKDFLTNEMLLNM